MSRAPLAPFTAETAAEKASRRRRLEHARCVALAYTEDSRWRNRAEFFEGRDAIIKFLIRKWNRELDYRPFPTVTNRAG